ncbi:MAG: HD domain-containing protein [Clostridia bacterium]|nr:HD domain-containing protein [Clostridia bacterium]
MDFKQLTNGQSEGFAIIKKCDVKVTAKGSEYLDMKLADSSGEVVARLWDYAPLIHGEYAVDDIVKVRGEITKYNGNDQLRIIKIRKAGPDDDVKPEDYVKSADYSGEYMYSKLISIAEDFEDDELKRLVLKMYSERKDLLLTWPAAFRLHHAVRGGLLMHTLSIVKLCEGVCEVYPFVNRELLITGAMLHDIAKTIEYSVSSVGTATGYTIEGNLIGHLVKGAMLVDRACEELSVSKEKAMLIEHMLISHHSEPEYGAAVRPMFLEAELLSELDNMDARVNQIARAVETLEKDEFSSKLWALNDRKMFNIMEKDKDLRVNLD